MKFTEDQLKSYAAPLSETEDQQCKNAIGMVRDALKVLGFSDQGQAIGRMYEDTLAYQLQMTAGYGSRKIKLFVQGSYANNTNVRTQSDVDIAVVQEDVFNTEYRYGVTDANYKFVTAAPAAKSFKDEVQDALKQKFGNDVERKNKSIKIHGNSYRKDADNVPCMRHRDYRSDYSYNPDNYVGGVYIRADSGEVIVNYPEQHIKNGREKNNETRQYYKKMVRIIKKMRYLMQDAYIASADRVSSFGLESALWNIPNEVFTKYSIYRYAFGEVVDYLYVNITRIDYYKEANGIKQLCPTTSTAEEYKQFIRDLKSFYEYDV